MSVQAREAIDVRRERVADLHAQGFGAKRIAKILGRPVSTVASDIRALDLPRHSIGRPPKYPRAGERPCESCGTPFTPRGDRVAVGWGRFCSRLCANKGKPYKPREAGRMMRCLYCGDQFWEWNAYLRTGRGKFCSHSCRAAYRWHREAGLLIAPLVTTMRRDGLWGPRARRRWEPRWKLEQVRAEGRRAKGREKAKETIGLALRLIDHKPDITRRTLIDALILHLEGRTPLYLLNGARRSARDPEYRKARMRIVRQLERGFSLEGEPPKLAPLIQVSR